MANVGVGEKVGIITHNEVNQSVKLIGLILQKEGSVIGGCHMEGF